MPHPDCVPKAAFIRVIMTASSMSDAARKLGCTRQAVSARLIRYKEAGITGLPEFSKELDVEEVQRLVNKQKRVAKRRK